MKQLSVQLILIAGTLAIAWRLLISYGQKAQALRRLGLLVFAAFAVWSILDPTVWTRLAQAVGIGRGADLILYGLVVAFFGFVVTTFRRFRDMELRYTRLARRLALDEAPPPPTRSESARGAGEETGAAGTLDQPIPPAAPDPENH